ncbi:MAG: hypothetical protein ABJK37_07790 [Paraglaciecola sp.]|uniref:Rap1a/Tai family immunity protein n=1 Tax=Paraglaciecola sp. TaxID=1920173 RepID=UPI003298B4C4
MLKSIFGQVLVLLMVGNPFNAHAIEKMTGLELQAVCQAFEKENDSASIDNEQALCAMYIKGYLAGEKLYRAEKMPPATFREKALKSRAGGLLEKYQMADDVSYCIPKSTRIEDIALLINRQSPANDASAESLIKSVLQQEFQCGR